MIRDGIDRQPLTGCKRHCGACARRCHDTVVDERAREGGWLPISTAPLARLDVVVRSGEECRFDSSPAVIEGLTSHGRVVAARYNADRADFADRWSNAAGSIFYQLTHWRPLEA